MALGTVLPFWPALLFTYLEPLALIVGWKEAFQAPSQFVTNQAPVSSSLTPVPDGALILSYQTANIYIILAGIAILCTAITREARVAKAYLILIAIGDLGHIYSSYKVLGYEVLLNFNDYNQMMWGNIGVSAFLHINRLATVLGIFGRLRGHA